MARPPKTHTVAKARINVDLALEVKQQLEDMRDRTNAVSVSEVIRRALSVYDIILKETEAGSVVSVVTPLGIKKQIVFL